MKWFHWLIIMFVIGATVWLFAYQAHAKTNVQDAPAAEPGPKWKIVVILDGPPGKQELTYGNQQHGVHWFATREECEAARHGGDKDFVKGMVALKAMQKKMLEQKVPIEITTACKMDDSV